MCFREPILAKFLANAMTSIVYAPGWFLPGSRRFVKTFPKELVDKAFAYPYAIERLIPDYCMY